MTRYRNFEFPHRALRGILCQFQLKALQTDYADPIELAALKELGTDMFELLHHHVISENEGLLPHIDKHLPGFLARETAEHLEVEAAQDELQAAMNALQPTTDSEVGYTFMLHLCRFHSLYLAHMNEEETETDELCWRFFTDEELHVFTEAIKAAIPPPAMLKWAKYALPMYSAPARAAIIADAQAKMPPAVFEMFLSVLPEDMHPVMVGA